MGASESSSKKSYNDFCLKTKKLLESFYSKEISISIDFICLKCLGILINPVCCKCCHESFCEECFTRFSDTNIYCLCNSSFKSNFEQIQMDVLNKSLYCIKSAKTGFIVREMNYIEAVQKINKYLEPSEIKKTKLIRLQIQKTYFKIDKSKPKETSYRIYIESELPKRSIKMLNYIHNKGYKMQFDCEYKKDNYLGLITEDYIRRGYGNISFLHLKEIEICKKVHFSFNFNFFIAKMILQNRERINSFIYNNFFNDFFINHTVISKALLACPRLLSIKLSTENNCFVKQLDLTFFHKYLFNKSCLQTLSFKGELFTNVEKYEYLSDLMKLKFLNIKNCVFENSAILPFFENILTKKTFLKVKIESNIFQGEITDNTFSKISEILEIKSKIHELKLCSPLGRYTSLDLFWNHLSNPLIYKNINKLTIIIIMDFWNTKQFMKISKYNNNFSELKIQINDEDFIQKLLENFRCNNFLEVVEIQNSKKDELLTNFLKNFQNMEKLKTVRLNQQIIASKK